MDTLVRTVWEWRFESLQYILGKQRHVSENFENCMLFPNRSTLETMTKEVEVECNLWRGTAVLCPPYKGSKGGRSNTRSLPSSAVCQFLILSCLPVRMGLSQEFTLEMARL